MNRRRYAIIPKNPPVRGKLNSYYIVERATGTPIRAVSGRKQAERCRRYLENQPA